MEWVIRFDQSPSADVAMVGGKGANLIALTAAGFPVPPGFVVTAEAYRHFLRELDWLETAIASFDFEDAEGLRRQCDSLQTRIGTTALPQTIASAIEEALTELNAVESDPFAVRSSSTLEDLAQAAFAGQHDTYLNVRTAGNLHRRVRDCFASLWSERAVLYRHHQGFRQQDVAMAVVVQRQIACDRAGVGFSINPVTGDLDRIVLNANYGLGESVVGGECEVDQFEVNKSNLEIVERNIGHKQTMVTPTPLGVEETAVPGSQSDEPCLSDGEIHDVARLLNRIETHYGWPQDIEWGWHDSRLYLFQSRAVTTFPPRYTRDESAERFPNPMTPLTWDFIRDVFRRSLTHSLQLMGLPPLKDDWFSKHDGYIYGNQNAVELLRRYRPLRARTIEELVKEIPVLREKYAWVSELPIRWARDLDRYLLRLGKLSARRTEELTVPELWDHILEIQKVATEYFLPNIAISMTQSFLHGTLLQLVALAVGREQAMAVFDGLLAGCETKTNAVNQELHEIAQLAGANTSLRQDLMELSGRAFWDQNRLQDYPEFAARLSRFLDDHGHREMDMDYYLPTWSGQPWVVIDSVALMLRTESGSVPTDISREQRIKHLQTELAVLGGLPEALRFFFRELIRLARTYTALDDLEHYQTTRVNPVARQAAVALGERLVSAGVLDAADDVFFFQRDELAELVAGFDTVSREHYRSLAARAKADYEEAHQRTPMWALGGAAVTDNADAHALKGLPGSPGRITAPCYLVHTPEDFGKFPPDSIIVARTTNPAWTALFYSAVGLITESGGPLSHGAVTAREMQLPAVMSVRGVMATLQDGQVVTVDGNQGMVLLESDA